jgi:phytoene/squalene synthetase
MSDTANPGKLASTPLAGAGEFDARLKRTDENRWLATRYAPAEARERLVAIYLLHQELGRALQAKEAMLGKIRIQWWRETLEQLTGKTALRRHDLSEELARVLKDRSDLIAPINDLIDRFDDVLDDHLRAGGHGANSAHEQRHLAAEAALARLAGRVLDASITPGDLEVLARCGEAHLAKVARLLDADARWESARKAARALPANLWPAILHLAPRDAYALQKRWRMFRAMASRRL